MNHKNLKIQSGFLKGKNIPVPPDVKKNSNFTPSLFKKSLFSIVESFVLQEAFRKEDAIFFDLFAGSGQIGFEALSRGFSKIVFYEIDKGRIASLRNTAKNFPGEIKVLNRDAFRFHREETRMDQEFAVYFLDPPYSYWKTGLEKINSLLLSVESLQKKKIILIQSSVDPKIKNFDMRKYGNNFLSFSASLE